LRNRSFFNLSNVGQLRWDPDGELLTREGGIGLKSDMDESRGIAWI